MGFVIEVVPLRGEVVLSRPGPVIRIGKGFGASTKEGVLFPKIEGGFPDNGANIFAGSDVQSGVIGIIKNRGG